jgi:hypothetical protein
MLTPLFDTARGTDWQTLHLTLAGLCISFRGREAATHHRWPANGERTRGMSATPAAFKAGRALQNCRPWRPPPCVQPGYSFRGWKAECGSDAGDLGETPGAKRDSKNRAEHGLRRDRREG